MRDGWTKLPLKPLLHKFYYNLTAQHVTKYCNKGNKKFQNSGFWRKIVTLLAITYPFAVKH